ncbi:hypothetical protein [Spirilliplanes yamanashiensis]|uniref:SnoaL-like domain-containing protein n=1 Tax=Spirilliplanes yamanashiensis TaxID=42233 RepID=A0A8J4DHR1_9ACTN|nr:hypothetical protein [Spirilliplanes yamanashiensis]MDP9814715.1 hypothetical protein [Spirilliplanes yamanashiensis]GIJ02367.1 hypothetical protein Sya03_17190 [Spirilliplanes yamanashiensis]
MPIESPTANVARFYAEAWTQRDPSAVRRIIAPCAEIEWNLDLPVDDEQLVQTLDRLAASARSVALVSETYAGERATMLYDCAGVFGSARVAEFLVVADGRITEVRQVWDPTAVRRYFPDLLEDVSPPPAP